MENYRRDEGGEHPVPREFPLNDGTMILLIQDFLKANPHTELFCLKRGQDGKWPLCVNDKGDLCYRDGNMRRLLKLDAGFVLNEVSAQSVEQFLGQRERNTSFSPRPVTVTKETEERFSQWMRQVPLSQSRLPELAPEHAELLKTLEEGYKEMVDTLKVFKYNQNVLSKVPSWQTVLQNIQKLGPEMLESIKKFGKPTLLMVPAGNLHSKIDRTDRHKQYTSPAGTLQMDTAWNEPVTSNLWGPEPAKFTVTIVDGAAEMPQLPGNKKDLNNKKKHLWIQEEYKKEKMRMITSHEYAMLQQLSLRRFRLAKNNSRSIIASSKNPEGAIIDKATVTFFNSEHLLDLEKIPCGDWDSVSHRFRFYWNRPQDQRNDLRGRPSVQVMEI